LKHEAKAHVLKHVNVVTLCAMVFESPHYGIVLEFVPNGCVDDFIFQNKVLSYLQKYWAYMLCTGCSEKVSNNWQTQ